MGSGVTPAILGLGGEAVGSRHRGSWINQGSRDTCLVSSNWCLEFGVWCFVFGVWCLVFGGYLVFGVLCLVFGLWSLVLRAVLKIVEERGKCTKNVGPLSPENRTEEKMV